MVEPIVWAMSGPRNLVLMDSARARRGRRRLRARAGRQLLGGGRQVASPLTDELQQRVEGGNELLNALTLERCDDIVVVDADGIELVEQVLPLVEIRLKPQLDPAMVLEGTNRLLGHRRDSLRPNQLLDVEGVAQHWIFR